MQYKFEWDPQKESINIRKHSVSFEEALTVFSDRKAISIYDEEHSDKEDRWTSIGVAGSGRILVVCHTFEQIDLQTVRIRVISSRKATKNEKRTYSE